MKKAAVSVLIPTYNRPHTLAEALESLARQTLPVAEIIVVNDAGSSVQEVVNRYADLPIQVIDLPSNSGHVIARNTGLAHVSQPWIMLLDDDDLVMPDHVETLWSNHEHADFLYADAEIFDYQFEGQTRIPTKRRLFAYTYDYGLLRTFNTIITSGSIYRASLHGALGRFDEAVLNYWDWDWCLRVAATARVERIPRATTLYAFASKGDNLSAQFTEKRHHYFQTFCQKHQLGELPIKNFFLMLEEPELKAYERSSELVWDGMPIYSRIRSDA